MPGSAARPVFAEEAPTTQTLEKEVVSQNEEPQPEPAPQNGEGQEPQGAPEQGEPQGEPEQGEPQGEPEQGEPQGEPEQGEPQEEPEQEEPPVRRVLKANAPMAVAEANIIVDSQSGNLFAGVGGQATFPVFCDNGDYNSLKAEIKENPPGLSVKISDGGRTVTVTADQKAQTGAYDLILTLEEAEEKIVLFL